MTIFALHGFLGRPQDFDALGIEVTALDYLKIRELSPDNPLSAWGKAFNQVVLQQTPQEKNRFLIGYSQGGRLALHAVKQNPTLWKGLILISANPGIPVWERKARLTSDQEWAQVFEEVSFQTAVEQWNSQPVFRGSHKEPVRREQDYNPHQLAKCLTQWSVGHQEDFRDFLKTTSTPVLSVSGEKDSKYVEMGQALKKQNPHLEVVTIPNSGHRVLFDNPTELKKVSHYFLQLHAAK